MATVVLAPGAAPDVSADIVIGDGASLVFILAGGDGNAALNVKTTTGYTYAGQSLSTSEPVLRVIGPMTIQWARTAGSAGVEQA